ncbi:hypothetical protein QEN19_000948 [Hanseniaspora menglaensis]
MLYLTFKAELSPTIKCVSLRNAKETDYTISTIKCLSCHESDSSKSHKVSPADKQEDDKGHEFNFIMKCKFCSNKMTLNLNIINETLVNYKYEHGDEDSDYVEKMKTAKFDFRKKHKYDKILPKNDNEDVAILVEMDSRGCVIEAVTYDDESNGLDIIVAGDSTMEELFLEDLELYDFDQANDAELSITDAVWELVKK